MILTTNKMMFVTDQNDSSNNIENLITEYGTNQYRIKIDRTLHPPYFELFHEWIDGKRRRSVLLFASSKLDKIVYYINKNIQ